MAENFKEIEGLLENADQSQDTGSKFRKYIRIILPHFLLVAAVCGYASVGAVVFHSIESPNEDALKSSGVERIGKLRRELVDIMWEQKLEIALKTNPNELTPEMLRIRDDWVAKVATHLQKFNENLYKAYKEEYVRYGDVRMTIKEQVRDPRLKRHRSSKSWTEKGGKMWTWSSALFFAATTMATIGYGNIVPVTVSGKIACVIFALIGAPLAIITIGDLGKFLSECTIWFYRKMKAFKKRVKNSWKLWKMRKAGVMVEYVEESESPEVTAEDATAWDVELDKEDVPVFLVFTILLLYIAFGGVLFAVLESWSYIDAFYFSFVSLTTIGFGDLVPDRHEYIIIMLIYLGVGLAVTTMCIDLVGIQYIQKIHYFGRKFQDTDLLQLLKRKRLIERRLALGQGEEIMHIIQKMAEEDQRQREPLPPPRLLPPLKSASQYWVNQTEEKYSLRSDSTLITPWNLSEVVVDESEFPLFEAEKVSPPTLISGPNSQRSSTISTTLTNSSASARSLMYRNWNRRGGSSIESGPDISFHCSLSTSPSVTAREFMYANYNSPQPSLQSFKFSFPLPSPDLRSIANAARSARRIRSAPSSVPLSPTDEPSSPTFSSISSTTIGLACMEEWDSYIQMVEESEKIRDPYVIPEEPSPVPLTPPLLSPSLPPTPPAKILTPSPPRILSPIPSPPHPPPPSPPKIPTPPPKEPSPPPKEPSPPPKEPSPPPKEPSPPPKEPTPPKIPTPPKTSSPPIIQSPPPPPPRVSSPIIPIHSIFPSMDLPSIPFIPLLPSPPEPHPFFHQPLQIIPEVEVQLDVEPMYVESIAVPMPMSSIADLLEVMIPEEGDEDIISPVFPESSSGSDTLSPMFDIDLGAFELVDSGVTAEALLSHDDPVIYHKDMPVHSVHHDTVQTEAALENLMNAPSSMMSESVPPAMVADNYCFVVDGDKVRMGDIMGDSEWWRHTSRPTKYFYSDDMKKFYRVTVISAKGKIISARLAGGGTSPGSHPPPPPSSSSTSAMVMSTALSMPSTSRSASLLTSHAAASYPGTTIHSAATTPRASMCVGSTKGHRGEKVPLSNVYKVIRVYSFWKTCTSFHRIVTMIDTVTPEDRNANQGFNKRLFVQYLWRNAKPYEKARVQKEFDPRRQRLLKFVADPESRKKAMKPMSGGSSGGPSTSVAAALWRRQPSGGSAPPTSSGGRPLSRASTVASEERLKTSKSRTSSIGSRGKKSPR